MASDPLALIRECISSGKVLWTYHVTMRLRERRLTSDLLIAAVATLEIIEEYPEDKYLPSYLVRAEVPEFVFHAVIAVDAAGDNIRVVTMYRPGPQKWNDDGRSRRLA
jgi:hypothetical protein